jgi:MFS family permease
MAFKSWASVMVLGSAVFLAVFDSLAVATALPTLQSELELRPSQTQWVITLNSLTIGGFLLLGGRVSDMWGHYRTLLASLAVLALGTVLAGTAPALPILLCGRFLQGAGAAFALPSSLALTGALFPAEPWKGRAFSATAIAGNTAGLAGAVIGGLLTASVGWRWVFFATVPLCLLALAIAALVLPSGKVERSRSGKLDMAGAALSILGLGGLLLGIGQIGDFGLATPTVAIPLFAGIALLGGFVFLEHRAASPLIRLGLLRSRRLIGGCLGIAAHSTAYLAVVVLGSLHLQDSYRFSPAGAGLALTPALLAGSISGLYGGRLVRRYGSRNVAVCGIGTEALAMLLLSLSADRGSYLLAVLPGFVLMGLGGGLAYVALTRETIGNAVEIDRGATSGIFESTVHLGGAFAVAAFVAIVSVGTGYGGAYGAAAIAVLCCCLAVLLLFPRGRPGTRPSS